MQYQFEGDALIISSQTDKMLAQASRQDILLTPEVWSDTFKMFQSDLEE